MHSNRILFIGNFLSKTKGTINPSEKLVANLQREGYTVSCASSAPGIGSRFREIFLSSLVSHYEVIHIDVFSGKALWFAQAAAQLARLRGKKVILNLHGGKLPEVYAEKRHRINYLLNRADHIVTPSNFIKVFFIDRGFNVTYLPNSIDLKHFPHNWSPALLQSKKILWVRAFSEIYNPHLAVDAFQEIVNKFPDATLTMIGPDGGLKTAILQYIKELGLQEKVHILGPVPNEMLHDYYCNHAVFLNTTAYESFGMGVLEAIACGIPVVSTAVGELPFLWKDGQEISFASENEAQPIAAKISDILTNTSYATKVSLAGVEKSKQFTWNVVRDKWTALLDQMGA